MEATFLNVDTVTLIPKMESARHGPLRSIYNTYAASSRMAWSCRMVNSLRYLPWNGTKKQQQQNQIHLPTESWKKMSIIYLIFLCFFFSSYLDHHLYWLEIGLTLIFTERTKKNARKQNKIHVILPNKRCAAIFFSFRMLFVHLLPLSHYFVLASLFFLCTYRLRLLEGLALTHFFSSSFNETHCSLFSLLK